mgnify:CR=1 FL=1
MPTHGLAAGQRQRSFDGGFSELTMHGGAPQVPRLHLEPAGPPPQGTPVSAPSALRHSSGGSPSMQRLSPRSATAGGAGGAPVFGSAAPEPVVGQPPPLFDGSLQLNDLPRNSAMTGSQDRSPRASVMPSAATFQIETPFSTDPESAADAKSSAVGGRKESVPRGRNAFRHAVRQRLIPSLR